MRRPVYALAVILAALVAGQAWATPAWYRITFTGVDMFNFSPGVDQLYNQDAPRRMRMWDANGDLLSGPGIINPLWTDTDSNHNGMSDYQEWAIANLAQYKISYFNLIGGTIAPTYWDQPYHAVPDNGDGTFGVNSWRIVQSPAGWTSGIAQANQGYQAPEYDNYAFPVWRAPAGDELTLANAATMTFSFDVLIENPESAFEPNGKLRVWFGGFDQPQDVNPSNEIGGVMLLDAQYIPAPSALLLVGIGSGLVTWLRRRAAV